MNNPMMTVIAVPVMYSERIACARGITPDRSSATVIAGSPAMVSTTAIIVMTMSLRFMMHLRPSHRSAGGRSAQVLFEESCH